jgi:ketosteroid isomerase-like protein
MLLEKRFRLAVYDIFQLVNRYIINGFYLGSRFHRHLTHSVSDGTPAPRWGAIQKPKREGEVSELEEIDLKNEKELVAQVIDKWLEGWSRKDIDVILRYVSSDVIAHLPNMPSIIGSEELKDFFFKYYCKRPLGPVIHSKSLVDVSESGDMAYEIGGHDHVVIEISGDTHIAPWNHIIILRKIEGEWKIIAISETNVK